jgi:hypothetical protein
MRRSHPRCPPHFQPRLVYLEWWTVSPVKPLVLSLLYKSSTKEGLTVRINVNFSKQRYTVQTILESLPHVTLIGSFEARLVKVQRWEEAAKSVALVR